MTRILSSILILIFTASFVFAEDDMQWEQAPPLNTSRMGHSAVVFDDAVYVFGGVGERMNILASVEMWHFGDDEWTQLDPMPVGMYYSSAVRFGNLIFILGGRNGQRESSNALLIFNPETGEFQRALAMPQGRAGLAAVSENNRSVLVMGGMSSRGGPEATGFRFFPSPTSRWSVDIPALNQQRMNFGMVWLGRPYAVGGIHYGPLNSVETLVENGWRVATQMPTARGELGVVVDENRIICAGGRVRNSGISDIVEAFTPSENQWTQLPAMLESRASFSLVNMDGVLLAIGGMSGHRQNGAYSNTVEYLVLHPDTNDVYIPAPHLPVEPMVSFFPNPSNSMVSFNVVGEGNLTLFDPIGRLILTKQFLTPGASWSWNVGDQPAGTYICRWIPSQGGRVSTEKLTILK